MPFSEHDLTEVTESIMGLISHANYSPVKTIAPENIKVMRRYSERGWGQREIRWGIVTVRRGTMTDTTNDPPHGASAWELDLWTHLTSHVAAERGLLDEYSKVAEQSSSKALRYLVNLLIEDEIRHHRIFTELAESIKAEAELREEDSIIPDLDFVGSERAEVLAATQKLMEHEDQDAHELQQ